MRTSKKEVESLSIQNQKERIKLRGDEMLKYQIYNFVHQCNVGQSYFSRRRARRRADKLDLDYGAIAHRIIEIYTN